MFIKIRKSNFGFYCEIKKPDAHDALKKGILVTNITVSCCQAFIFFTLFVLKPLLVFEDH